MGKDWFATFAETCAVDSPEAWATRATPSPTPNETTPSGSAEAVAQAGNTRATRAPTELAGAAGEPSVALAASPPSSRATRHAPQKYKQNHRVAMAVAHVAHVAHGAREIDQHERCIIAWLNANKPTPAAAGLCQHCEQHLGETGVIAVLTGCDARLWLHHSCHRPWTERRRQEAIAALEAMGWTRDTSQHQPTGEEDDRT